MILDFGELIDNAVSSTVVCHTSFAGFSSSLAPVPTGAQNSGIQVSSPEQIKEDFVSVPCKNEERLAAVRSLFERAGAQPSDVTIDKYKDVENLVVTKKESLWRRSSSGLTTTR